MNFIDRSTLLITQGEEGEGGGGGGGGGGSPPQLLDPKYYTVRSSRFVLTNPQLDSLIWTNLLLLKPESNYVCALVKNLTAP